jgi:hypothetical protein
MSSGFIQLVDGKVVIGGSVNIDANGPKEDITFVTDGDQTQDPVGVIWKKGEKHPPSSKK